MQKELGNSQKKITWTANHKRPEKCSGKPPPGICPVSLLFPWHLPLETARRDTGLARSCFCLRTGFHTFLIMFQHPLWNGNITAAREGNKQQIPNQVLANQGDRQTRPAQSPRRTARDHPTQPEQKTDFLKPET